MAICLGANENTREEARWNVRAGDHQNLRCRMERRSHDPENLGHRVGEAEEEEVGYEANVAAAHDDGQKLGAKKHVHQTPLGISVLGSHQAGARICLEAWLRLQVGHGLRLAILQGHTADNRQGLLVLALGGQKMWRLVEQQHCKGKDQQGRTDGKCGDVAPVLLFCALLQVLQESPQEPGCIDLAQGKEEVVDIDHMSSPNLGADLDLQGQGGPHAEAIEQPKEEAGCQHKSRPRARRRAEPAEHQAEVGQEH
mmetsp:Transcript_77687/g.186381  ORF Transcript_77687/g.186381 Transcript_77687/m.186381 type:complete len:254 (+) Transcript_77687:738-1499(+)